MNNFLHIKDPNNVLLIEFYNVNGNKVFECKNTDNINIELFQSGLYFVKIYCNDKIVLEKIIKN